MKVFGQMVVRNEAARYLDCSLAWHSAILDEIHVFDDQSTDSTREVARFHGCKVTERGSTTPGFLQHEGQFRQAAWWAFEKACQPSEDDWVLCIDADEFLMGRRDEAAMIWDACKLASEEGLEALVVAIPEVFAVTEAEDGILVDPQVRMDGYWGTIQGTRLFRYRKDGVFADKPMGSGSEPTYVATSQRLGPCEELWLMHYGYALPEDQRTKYARYSGTEHGHSDAHVQSILNDPYLRPWDGPHIDVWQGRR